MKKLISKLRARAGETLVETLMAILIFTLASVAMYSMVTSAAEINTSAKEMDRDMYTQMAVVEAGEGSSTLGQVSIVLEKGEETVPIDTVDVYVYGSNAALHAYYADPTEPTTEETTP